MDSGLAASFGARIKELRPVTIPITNGASLAHLAAHGLKRAWWVGGRLRSWASLHRPSSIKLEATVLLPKGRIDESSSPE